MATKPDWPATQGKPNGRGSKEKKGPAFEFRCGLVKATCWANDTRNGVMYSTTVSRLYKGEDNDWKETSSLGPQDLLVAAHLQHQVFSRICEMQQES